MLILLTNDDGIYAPGLAAMQRQLRQLGELCLVAPTNEQSGVGHSITYLTPLIVKEVFHGETHWGWAVEGSPADCVKLGITEFCARPPDLIVSGMNLGLNAGINVLYSGTVAAAIEGAFYGITSVAVSLEFDEHAPFDKAARLATSIIQQILQQKGPQPQLYNLNIPTAALKHCPQVAVVPMDITRYGDRYEKRIDPWGREYYWITGAPPVATEDHPTDLSALAEGRVTLTPLSYNMTKHSELAQIKPWQFQFDSLDNQDEGGDNRQQVGPMLRTQRKMQQAVPPQAEEA